MPLLPPTHHPPSPLLQRAAGELLGVRGRFRSRHVPKPRNRRNDRHQNRLPQGPPPFWCLADLTPWALFVPMALSSVGNGLSQPPGVAAGLSVYPRIAGAASGLLGFMQMAVAALGTLLLGLLPRDSVVAMIAVVGTSLALAFLCGLLTLRPPFLPVSETAKFPA